MGENQVERRFFKIMMSGFKKRLMLPKAFCNEEMYAERAILESSKGRYEIKVSRSFDDDHQMILEDGWARFVDEHRLRLGYVVVFEHTQDLQFNVVVFGRKACEKLYLPEPVLEQEAEAQAEIPLHNSFTLKMTPYLATKRVKVTIPIEFVRMNNLEKIESASLRVGGGRRWEVKVWAGKSNNKFRVLMGRGWHEFYVSNSLQVGDVCVFKLIPTSSPTTSTNVSFDVHITRAASCNTNNRHGKMKKIR